MWFFRYNEGNNHYFAAYSNWQPGFKTGVGAEFMVGRNLSLRAQYSVLTIADRTAYGAPSVGASNTGRTIWTNSQSVATIGAAWHF